MANSGLEVSLAELESMAEGIDSLMDGSPTVASAVWVRYESEVRAAHAAATSRLRQHGGERCYELFRLLEIEEQTRCHAFQGVLMREVPGPVYQSTLRSILEKLLAKLETMSSEPALYRGVAQCLSEYMSALNHHCDTCSVPSAEEDLAGLKAIAETEAEALEAFDSSSIASADSHHSDSTNNSSVRSERVLSVDAGGGGVLTSVATIATGIGGVGVVPSALPTVSGCGASTAGSLTEEQRKQRRRESNRSASSKYRSKKTTTLSTLMAENAALRQQVASFSSQTAVLSAENKLLKQQVSFLQGILQGQPGASQQAGGAPTPPPAEGPGHVAGRDGGGPAGTMDYSTDSSGDMAMSQAMMMINAEPWGATSRGGPLNF